jgi:hypothetical protein
MVPAWLLSHRVPILTVLLRLFELAIADDGLTPGLADGTLEGAECDRGQSL